MHRIDGPGATPDDRFTEGDPNTGVPATVVTADWMNAVQEELVAVIAAAGMPLDKPDNAQVLAAINALARRASPVGQVIQGYWTAAPAGTLLLEGDEVGRDDYPALWAHAQAIGVVVSEAAWAAGDKGRFGAGDGATTFRLPDLRDEFIRVKGDARGLGSLQADAVQAHKHVGGLGTSESSSAPFGATTGANHVGTTDHNMNNHLFHTNDGTNLEGAVNPAGVIAEETRPRNVALLHAIYY